MAALAVLNPIPQFFELDGDPLDNGSLYFGVANQNPITAPIQVYWDSNQTIPAAQPIRTKNGYPSRAGSPAIIYASTEFSLLVQDSRGRNVFYAPSSEALGSVVQLQAQLANTADVAQGDAMLGVRKSGASSGTTQHEVNESRLFDAHIDFGAPNDGLSAALGGINAAIAAAVADKRVWMAPGSFLVASAPSNIYGVQYDGPGNVLMPITGGNQQLNTYADDDKVFIGKEYLYRVYERMRLGYVTPIKAFAFGDSTVAGDAATTPFLIQNLMPLMAQRIGLPVPLNVTNRGVGGTTVSDMNALPDLAVDTDLFIIKYGINDGANPEGTRLNTFATQLRSKLAAIRAAAFGNYTTLSIVLVGPNATSDTPNGRDERWYEQLRGIYVQAARDYKCAYFDTYAYLKDARGAATYWMDDPFGDGRAIHPKDMMYQWIWGAVLESMFPLNQIAAWRINSFSNVHSSVITPPAANAPSNYAYGETIYRATLANGWPIDGMVHTVRSVDGVAVQTVYPFAPGTSASARRVASTAGDTWNRWTGVLEAIPLAGTWVNYGGTWATPQAVISEDGIVVLKGLIKNGAAVAGSQLGTLPAGMRPAETCVFSTMCGAAVTTGCAIRLEPSGGIFANSAVDTAATSLNGISFKAA
jgi:lysophospholipase L1-like esterase